MAKWVVGGARGDTLVRNDDLRRGVHLMMREGGGKQRLITFSAATVSASARAQIKSEFDLFMVFLLFELRKTATHRCFQIARQMNECVYHAVT